MKEAKRNGTYEPTGISQPGGNIKYKRHTVRPARMQLQHWHYWTKCGMAASCRAQSFSDMCNNEACAGRQAPGWLADGPLWCRRSRCLETMTWAA